MHAQYAGAPWDLWVAFSFLVTMVLAYGIIRICYYFFHDKADDYGSMTATLAVRGLRVLQVSGFVSLLFIFPLGTRVQAANSRSLVSSSFSASAGHAGNLALAPNFFSLEAVILQWWCIIRMVSAFLVWAASYLFDSHPVFRITCITLTPMLLVLDWVSFAGFTAELWCMDQGVCAYDADERLTLQLMGARDLVSSVLCGCTALFSFWLLTLFGPCSNWIYLPRKEHRSLSNALDKSIVAKPRLKLPASSEEQLLWNAYAIREVDPVLRKR